MRTHKVCFKCKELKPLDDFYKHKAMYDGHVNKCKECNKTDVKKHRRENDSVREYDRWRYYNNPDTRLKILEHTQNWINKNPKARAAHIELNNAVRSGRIIKQPCQVCGDTYRTHGHHDDYSKPLEVKWFCAKHHQRLHHGD